jgi:hypothetical protein
MEKLSGIIPTSKRVTASDPRPPGTAARPGAPSFGRPIGTSALAEQKLAEQKRLDQAPLDDNLEWEKAVSEQMTPQPDMVPRGTLLNIQA